MNKQNIGITLLGTAVGVVIALGLYYVSNDHNISFTNHPNSNKSQSVSADGESVHIVSNKGSDK